MKRLIAALALTVKTSKRDQVLETKDNIELLNNWLEENECDGGNVFRARAHLAPLSRQRVNKPGDRYYARR